MLKLKLQYFGHLMQRADSFEKNLLLSHVSLPSQRYQNIWDSKRSVKSGTVDPNMLRFSVGGGEWDESRE